MDTQRPPRQFPNVQFRVLIIGRANAGKTSILQRVCDTTESPVIYRRGKENLKREEVKLEPTMDRGEHTIDDELVFSNHEGYVFHDSRGIESGGTEELGILQEFIRYKCGERKLRDKLHAIWFCIPMDNQRPKLDLKFYKDICPDQNVPVIALFTKYDQFLRNIEMHVADYPSEYPNSNGSEVAEKLFQELYLHPLGDDIRYVRLEKMHKENMRCDHLIEETAAALNEDTVSLMLLAVQRGNLELSVKTALNHVHQGVRFYGNADEVKSILVRECLISFPYIWFYQFEEDLSQQVQYPDQYSNGKGPLRRNAVNKKVNQIEQDYETEDYYKLSGIAGLRRSAIQVTSLSTIQNLIISDIGWYHLNLAVILILKRATFLLLSNLSAGSALTLAELDYQKANIDLKIQKYLGKHYQKHSIACSVEQLANFIMAIDFDPLMPSQSSVQTHVTPSQEHSANFESPHIDPLVPSQSSHTHQKDHGSEPFWKSLGKTTKNE